MEEIVRAAAVANEEVKTKEQQEGKPKKKRTHVTKACLNCQRLHASCDHSNFQQILSYIVSETLL